MLILYSNHKPCSVYAAIYLYLSISSLPFNSFQLTPLQIWVSRLWVYPFHFVVSNRTRLCGTFKLASIVALRIKVAVKLMPRLIYSSSTNTTIIADCASMDFPLVKNQRLRFEYISLLYFDFDCLDERYCISVCS